MGMLRIVFIALLTASPAFAIQECGSGQRFSCVVDGDTIWYQGEKIRMAGYDAPETHTNLCGGQAERRLGKKTTARLVEILNSGDVVFDRVGSDRYGRTLANFYVHGQSLADILVSEGLARYWPNGSEFWCR
jgi:micrococcal nuclease